MSSENDPIKSAAKGVVEGILEWSEEQLKVIIRKFKDKNLAFVEDESTIERAKELRKKGELAFFKNYVKRNNLRILFLMGLTLRGLDKKEEDFKALISLREKILKKDKRRGLHIAQFVQNGLFSRAVPLILEKSSTEDEIKFRIEKLFDNIDNVVAFIQKDSNMQQKINEITTKIQAHSPEMFAISSVGGAMDICEEVKNSVMKSVSSQYTCEEYSKEDENKRVYFLTRSEELY